MAEVKVVNAQGRDSGSTELNLVSGKVRGADHVVYEAVKMYQANRRLGSVHKKNRSAVAGGRRKPWKQKGTGRARQGTTRAPQWRGGGRAFPPMERDYSYQIPRKMRQLATKLVLASKATDGTLRVAESFPEFSGKTKEVALFLRELGWAGQRVLILFDSVPENLLRAARNIPGLVVGRYAETNAHQVIYAERVLVDRAAFVGEQE
jgi:large subunit ribosomal protein L4